MKQAPTLKLSRGRWSAALVVLASLGPAAAHLGAQAGSFNVPSIGSAPVRPAGQSTSPTPAAITPNGTVVEDVVARINDQIITRTEYERSLDQLQQQAQQEGWPASTLQDRQRNLLRDMIDQQLLLSKGKELGITGDAETMRQLDDMRKKAGLDSMEALEKAAEQQGVSFEDFRQNIRNQIISQQVVRDEVGRHINMTRKDEEAYYQAHSKDFEVPEQVHLSEILIPTPENATDAQVTAAQAKADEVAANIKGGASFVDVAKASSGGPTASAGGDLGDFKRGMLGDVLEKATFSLPVGGVTDPIRTRQGFVILKVDSHQQPGLPPLDQVEPQVQEALYLDQLQPALRTYLSKAREDAYMSPLPAGFVDTGAPRQSTSEVFTAYEPPKVKKKVLNKQKAEQAAAAKAQAQLAVAREKLAAKQAATAAAAKGGVKTVAATNSKPKKVRREKVRFGQAPRNSLPSGTAETAVAVPSLGASSEAATGDLGVAPGAAMTSLQASTTVSNGVGTENDDPLAPKAPEEHKTRFSSRQHETDEKKASLKLASAEVKADKKPVKATQQEAADENLQAKPLGLKGDTVKKPKKVKRKKGQPVERLQDRPKPAGPAPIEPTVNPALGSSVSTTGAPASTPRPTSDQSTLPPTSTDTAAPGALPGGQPIPATTGTTPNAPASTVPQPH